MARVVNIGKKVIDEFSAFDVNMQDKISGLSLPDDFSITVFYNKTLDSLPVTIGEYGSTGSYWVEFTPNKLGFWEVEVKYKDQKQYWFETYDVMKERDPGEFSNRVYDIRGTVVWNSQRDELVAMSWLTNNGRISEFDGQCHWDFYNSDNNFLFSMDKNAAYPTGIYRSKRGAPGFDVEENYYYTCKIHDGVEWRKSALGFITII